MSVRDEVVEAAATDGRLAVRCAARCARTVLDVWHVEAEDTRPHDAIQTAEAWVDGHATAEQCHVAAQDAMAASAEAAEQAQHAVDDDELDVWTRRDTAAHCAAAVARAAHHAALDQPELVALHAGDAVGLALEHVPGGGDDRLARLLAPLLQRGEGLGSWFERTVRRAPAPLPPDATREGLLADVIAHPDDDRPRWVASDWYQQQADPRGELIAVQLTLAGLPEDDPRHAELVTRQDALLKKHKAAWVGRFRGARTEYGVEGGRTWVKGSPTHWTFARGFVDTVKMAAVDFVANAEELLRCEPVRLAKLTKARGRLQAFVEDCPALEELRGLDLSRGSLTDDDLVALFTTERLRSLEVLDLAGCRIGVRRGARVFAQATARFPRLHTLMLGNNGLGDASVQALAGCRFLGTVRTLGLGYDKLGRRGAEALLASPHTGGLVDLRVRGNRLSEDDEARLRERFTR